MRIETASLVGRWELVARAGVEQDIAFIDDAPDPNGVSDWSRHALNRHGQALLRSDDGDTKISDGLGLRGTRLLRTMNVVTDELYVNRQLLAYERRG